MFSFHPKFYGDLHVKEDVEPKQWCCSLSDKCYLYLAARPIDNCFNYFSPFLSESLELMIHDIV